MPIRFGSRAPLAAQALRQADLAIPEARARRGPGSTGRRGGRRRGGWARPGRRRYRRLAGHREVVDALVGLRVADVVLDPAVQHSLAERLVERQRPALRDSRPVPGHPQRGLTAAADLAQDGDVAVQQVAGQPHQGVEAAF